MKLFVTGVAGFIGMHVTRQLLLDGYEVIGIDNLNDYYDKNLKLARLDQLISHHNFQFIKGDILDAPLISSIFQEHTFDVVIHFAAQAGVRYSIQNPHVFINNNVTGFLNILEGCRQYKPPHLIFASSSSVYGSNSMTPFSERDFTDHPLSPYGASKKAGELISYSYSHLYNIPVTCLRLFTVYGPWGRPDQAPSLFLDAALSNRPIKIFNNGGMLRDFTYIDDVVAAVIRTIKKSQEVEHKDSHSPAPPAHYKIFNVGASQPTPLMDFIKTIENTLGFEMKKEFLAAQDGDVLATHADIREFEKWVNLKPATSINEGVRKFVEWYRSFYKI